MADISRRRLLELTAATGAVSLLPSSVTAAADPIDYGDTVTGDITEDDPTDPNWSEYHTEPRTFTGDAGDEITVELSFDGGFEPYIHVVGPSGDDIIDSGGSPKSETLSADGEHTIYPQGWSDETPGEYTLTLNASTNDEQQDDDTEDDNTEDDDQPEDTEDFEDVGEDPAYTVKREVLGASPTRAIFSMKVEPHQSTMIEDYESGTVSGLQLSLSTPDTRIARITPLPKDDGDLFEATGSVLLASASLLGGPIGAAATVASLATGSIELTQEVQEKNIESSEGTRTALFSGDSFGGNEFLGDSVKYLIEIESPGTTIDDLSDEFLGVDGWEDVIQFGYEAEPQQPPSSTDLGTQGYAPELEGDFEFTEHCG